MRIVRVLSVLLLLVAVVGAAAYGVYVTAVSAPQGEDEQAVEFMVPKGATLRSLGPALVEAGLLKDLAVWTVHLKLNRTLPSPKAGRHQLRANMNIHELVEALAANPMSEDAPLTMLEGWRLRDADAALAEQGRINPGEYIAAAKDKSSYDIDFEVEGEDLAGYLLPETYLMPRKIDPRRLVQRQLDAFSERFVKPNQAEIARSKRSLRTIVIMASMLEREESKPQNRPDVAHVLYKRLDDNWALGVDATSRFTLDDWNDRRAFLRKLRDPKDPYNTRLRRGLPPGPIGAPSLDALSAALRPKTNPYWYYLHDRNGRIHFARTAKGHARNKKQYNVY